MSDDMRPTPGSDEPYYTETVIEYVDNRRQRAILGILLVVLFLLLIAASYAVYRLTPGKGAPTGETQLPKGITWVRSIYGWGDGPQERLLAPTDVAIAENGTIWVVSGHETISSYSPDGTPRRVFKPKGVVSIEGIDVGENGNLYVTDYGGQVVEFDTSGKMLDQWKVQTPQGVDWQDGKIAVSASNGIAVFTEDQSKVVLQVGGPRGWGEDQFDLPHAILAAEDGTLYVADTQNRRVKVLSSKGRNLWSVGVAPDRSQPGVADVRSQESTMSKQPFLLPSGLTFDGNGRVVVVDPFKFRIAIIDPKTKNIAREKRADGKPGRAAYYGDQGEADGFFGYPTGIDYDETRDWFAVADTANNRVQIIRLPGTGGSALAPIIGGFRWPMCIFCLPIILLIIAIILAALRRRRERELTPEEAAEIEAGVTMESGDSAY